MSFLKQANSSANTHEKQSEPCSRWHSLRGRYSALFDEKAIATVEEWYNTVASKSSREAFQRCSKQILNTTNCVFTTGDQLKHSPTDDVKKHAAIHFANLYGKIMSDNGKRLLASWALTASPSDLEDVRVSFAAIQSNLKPCSVTKEAFTPKLPDIHGSTNKEWNRKKIDWMSQKVQSHMQSVVNDPMRGGIAGLPGGGETSAAPSTTTSKQQRITKPKSQFDYTSSGGDLLKSLGIDGGTAAGADALDTLRQKREAAAHALLTERDENGCLVYTCKRAAGAEGRAHAGSRNRIVATMSENDTSGWQTTTRETIRDYSGSALARPIRVSPETHPSMSRVTASLGMVVPHPSLKPK